MTDWGVGSESTVQMSSSFVSLGEHGQTYKCCFCCHLSAIIPPFAAVNDNTVGHFVLGVVSR